MSRSAGTVYPPTADEPIRSAFASVLQPDGRVVGGGVLVASAEPGQVEILTCAHVVNLALGRGQFAVEEPNEADTVTVAFPVAPGVRARARVSGWWPARSLGGAGSRLRSTDQRWRGDIALLRVADALSLPGRPITLAAPQLGKEAWTWFGSGEPTTIVSTRVTGVADEWLVLGGSATGHAVQPGYSGSPLWDRERQIVIGMLVSAHHVLPYTKLNSADPARQSYAIRADVIAEHCLGSSRGQSEAQSSDVQALLQAQRSAARAFPYRAVGLHRQDPATVYVRQQVSTSLVAGGAMASHPDTNVAAPDLEALKPKTVEAALAAHRHVLLIGEAGSGKSSLTLQLATRQLLLTGGRSDITLLPVRVLARDLAARPHTRLMTAVADAVRVSLARFLPHSLDPGLLESQAPGSRWLIIIDGLDEVTDPLERNELTQRLMVFMEQSRDYHLLVTTRPLPMVERRVWERDKDLTQYTIEPFRHDQRAEFAKAWFAQDEGLAHRFLAELGEARFAEVASIPLLITVAAIVFEEDPEHPLPASRFDLYERYFSYLYDSRSRQLMDDIRARLAGWPQAESIAQALIEARVNLIEHLAPHALHTRSLLATALDWLRREGIAPQPLPPDWSAVVASVLTSTGLLAHDGDGLRFTHHTFAEHICDLLDARRLPSRFDPDEAAWWRVLRLACAPGGAAHQRTILHRALLNKEAEELLDWLLAGNDLARILAVQLLSNGVPAARGQHAALARTLDYWLWRATHDRQFHDHAIVALDLLRAVSRPVERVLHAVIDDVAAPEPLRIAASRTLLRCGEPHRAHALKALQRLLADTGVSGRRRLEAARLLLDSGQPEMAQDGLMGLAGGGASVHPFHRQWAGDMLAGEVAQAMPLELWPVQPGDTQGHSFSMVVDPLNLDNHPEERPAGWPNPITHRCASPGLEPVADRQQDSEVPGGIGSFLSLDSRARAEDVVDALAEVLVNAIASGLRGHGESRATGERGVQYWPMVAAWLSNHRPAAGSRLADHIQQLLERTPVLTSSVTNKTALLSRTKRLLLAALLAHGNAVHQRASLALLTPDMTAWNVVAVTAVLGTLASRSTEMRGQVTERACLIALDLKLPNTARTAIVEALRLLDLDAAVHFLTRRRTADPYIVVSTLLRLGAEFRADAVSYLDSRAAIGLTKIASSWCQAVDELIRTTVAADRDEALRLLKRAAIRSRNPAERLTMATALASHDPDSAIAHASEVAQGLGTAGIDKMNAARLLSTLEGSDAQAALHVLDAVRGAVQPLELAALAADLAHMDPTVRDVSETILRAQLASGDLDLIARERVLQELADLGPRARAGLADDIGALSGQAVLRWPEWFSTLEGVALWGPDLHEAAQSALVDHALSPGDSDRIAAVRRIGTLEWRGAGVRASDILTALAESNVETPAIRALAARKLTAYDDQCRLTARHVLGMLTTRQELPALLAIQLCMELALAGEHVQALTRLSGLALDHTLPDAHRSEAARLMLMIDTACGGITVATLTNMAADATLTSDTRQWVADAPLIIRRHPQTP
ncbi:trypsin-like peptidase domain-containing protein [Kitasatospora sp. NPDC001095]